MNTILGLVLLLIFVLALLAIVGIIASFAGAFDFGVRVGEGNITRQVTFAELMIVLIVAILAACVSLLFMRKMFAG